LRERGPARPTMHKCKICDAGRRLPREGLGGGAKCQVAAKKKSDVLITGVLLDCHLLVKATAARVQALVVVILVPYRSNSSVP
jgi:hypothetical protein